MTEIWDMADHLEHHPEDHEARWKMAKRLYAAWEYDQALEHLLILEREWEPRLNVGRYLAATLYRLGRNDEALKALETALDRWPEETTLREQMTRVLEGMGEYDRAGEVWGEILERQPDHPLGKKALARIARRKKAKADTDGKRPGGMAKSPGFFATTKPCAHCGAANVEDAVACWQCGEPMGSDPFAAFDAATRQSRTVSVSPETVSLIVVAAIALMALAGVFLTLRMIGVAGGTQEEAPIRTVADLYARQIPASRILVGISMVILWPLILHLAVWAVRPARPVPGILINLTGLLMGTMAYMDSFFPYPMTALAVLMPALLSLIIIVAVFRLRVEKAVLAWALHLFLVYLMGILLFFTAEAYQLGEVFRPLKELRAVAAYTRDPARGLEPGMSQLPGSSLPWEQRVVWRSTGSEWLDRRSGATAFLVLSDTDGVQLKFQIYDASGARVFDYVNERQLTRFFEVTADTEYRIVLDGPEGQSGQVIVQGLLIPEFLE
ncbi:MAG: tetratricopeptide repeat protein [Candidatus Hydrogenedentes bacterium]|nr:tetratricopeptide repeat protein [Candidatus Hydrogenedentota bacterium]